VDQTATIRRDARFQLLTAELRFGNEVLRDIEDENLWTMSAFVFGSSGAILVTPRSARTGMIQLSGISESSSRSGL
jgi:hypothetical protein